MFSASEHVVRARSSMMSASTSANCDNCIGSEYIYSGSGPNGMTPNSTLTGVVGCFIISTTDVTDPCTTNIAGQVNDIFVDIQ